MFCMIVSGVPSLAGAFSPEHTSRVTGKYVIYLHRVIVLECRGKKLSNSRKNRFAHLKVKLELGRKCLTCPLLSIASSNMIMSSAMKIHLLRNLSLSQKVEYLKRASGELKCPMVFSHFFRN